jgi:CHASE2 domain-containing sensor protein
MFSKAARTNLRHSLRQLRRKYGGGVFRLSASILFAYGFFFLWATPWGRGFDIWQARQFFSLRGPVPMPDDIVLVAIDDMSFHELGASPRWPFPREHFAAALEALVEAKP